MSRRLAVVTVVLMQVLVSGGSFAGDTGKLRWMSFNDGLVEAQRTGKKVMVDVYTDWCGWCKKMDKDTYENSAVAQYLSKNFVSIKLNAEADGKLTYRGQRFSERELSAAFGVTGYPSILFLRSDGEPITVLPGYSDATRFKVILSYIAEDKYKTMSFDEYSTQHK
jgi:thioredoxin-related protein